MVLYKFLKRTFFVLLALFGVVFCASEEKKESSTQDLNASPDEAPVASDASNEESDASNEKEVKELLSVQKKEPDDWRSFFKPPPGNQERALLQKSVLKTKEFNNHEDILDFARKQHALGHFEEAEKLYRHFIREKPDDLKVRLELAMVMLQKHDFEKVFKILEEIRYDLDSGAAASRSLIFQFRYTLALAYYHIDNRSKCHEILTDLIGEDKSFTPGYAALASSYFAMGKDDVAEFVLLRGIERSRESETLLNLLGVISQKKGLFEKAEYWYNRALEINSEFAPVLTNKGVLAIRRFQYEEAERLLKQSISLQPSATEAYIALSIAYMNQNRPEDARTLLDKVLAGDPRNTLARYNLGVLTLYSLKNPFKALQYFEESIQTSGETEDDIRWASQNYINDIKHSKLVR